jgi:Na+/H+ antiporter NhaD/arsenite permease-like protein
MDFINNFTNSFTNSIKNIEISSYINLLIGMGIIVLFLIFTPIISYHLVKLFYKDVDKTKKSKQENKQKIKKSNIYKSLYLVFLVTGIFIAFKVMDLTVNQDLIVNKIYRIFLIWLVSTAIAAIF